MELAAWAECTGKDRNDDSTHEYPRAVGHDYCSPTNIEIFYSDSPFHYSHEIISEN